MTRFLSGPTRSVVNIILFTLDLSCRRHDDLYYFSAVRASKPENDFKSPVAPDVQHPPAAYRAYTCFHHMASFPRFPYAGETCFQYFPSMLQSIALFLFPIQFCNKKAAGFLAFPAALMYALFFFWFPYCRDKVVAFGAFRCDLHLSGGIRPYVQQTPAASWTSQLFHLVFIFFRNHFPPSFGCLCRKGTGQIIPVPFSFVAQGRGGFSRNALLCISTAYGGPSGHCLPFSSFPSHSESYMFHPYVWISVLVPFPPFRISTVPRFPQQLSWNKIFSALLKSVWI